MKELLKDAKVDVIALSSNDVIATSGETGSQQDDIGGGGGLLP